MFRALLHYDGAGRPAKPLPTPERRVFQILVLFQIRERRPDRVAASRHLQFYESIFQIFQYSRLQLRNYKL